MKEQGMNERWLPVTVSNSAYPSLAITNANEPPVIQIFNDGRIFWREREVVGDDDFKAAMIDLLHHLRGTL